MRICITAFCGWGNCGDEGILLAIMDSLGLETEYVVCTSLPFNMFEEYESRLRRSVPMVEVRQIYDVRGDYDAFILGGGCLNWGYGWGQALTAFTSGKPSMNYGVGFRGDILFSRRLWSLYRAFLVNFNAMTVRDEHSKTLLRRLGVDSTLSMCPGINLKEEKFDACPEGMIAICPRYEDYPLSNEPQMKWIVENFKDSRGEVLLVPLAPYNKQGVEVDLALCREVSKRVGRVEILEVDGFSPRRVKYALSRSKLVVSGGRYHAILWAITHGVPYKVYPGAPMNYPKINALLGMHRKYGDRLMEMERRNGNVFTDVVNKKSVLKHP